MPNDEGLKESAKRGKEKEKGPAEIRPWGHGETGRAANSPRATFRWLRQRFRRQARTVSGLTSSFCTESKPYTLLHQSTPLWLEFSKIQINTWAGYSAGWHARDAIRPRCPRADSDAVSSHTTGKRQCNDYTRRVSNRNHLKLIKRWETGVVRHTLRDNATLAMDRANDRHKLNGRRANRLIGAQ